MRVCSARHMFAKNFVIGLCHNVMLLRLKFAVVTVSVLGVALLTSLNRIIHVDVVLTYCTAQTLDLLTT